MTTENRASTNGRVHVNGAQPDDADAAPDAAKPRAARDLLVPALILLGLAFVLRRLV